MPQIAQQEYLIIDVGPSVLELPQEAKKRIQEAHQRGYIFDVILKTSAPGYHRIIADRIDVDDSIVVWTNENDAVEKIDVSL